MALKNTITEQDMDAASHQFVKGFRQGENSSDPDLDVDGLTESLLSRLIRLFSFGRH